MSRPQSGDIAMKLHSGTHMGGWRVAEFWRGPRSELEIGLLAVDKDGEECVKSIQLTEREAKALRHWLDAALEVSA